MAECRETDGIRFACSYGGRLHRKNRFYKRFVRTTRPRKITEILQPLESSLMAIGKRFSWNLRKLGGTYASMSIVRYAFYAFIFSVPFETVARTVMGIGMETLHVSKLAGYGFVVSALLFQPRLFLKFPPQPFWCFGSYLYIYLLHLILLEGPAPNEFRVAVQMLILFWLSYNIMEDKRVVESSLTTLFASILLLSVLQVLGIISVEIAGGRISGREMDSTLR